MYWSISDNGEGVKRRRIQQKFPKLSLDTIATGENSCVLPLACGSLSVLLVRVCWRNCRHIELLLSNVHLHSGDLQASHLCQGRDSAQVAPLRHRQPPLVKIMLHQRQLHHVLRVERFSSVEMEPAEHHTVDQQALDGRRRCAFQFTAQGHTLPPVDFVREQGICTQKPAEHGLLRLVGHIASLFPEPGGTIQPCAQRVEGLLIALVRLVEELL